MPNGRFIPARLHPLFGDWYVRDTLTGVLFNGHGPIIGGDKSSNGEGFIFRREAQDAATRWNALTADQSAEIHPAFATFRDERKAQVAA